MPEISTDGNDWKSSGLSMREMPSRDMLVQRIATLEAERDCVFAGELIPGVLADRIGNLERERALLLAYARAARALIATVGTETEGLPDAEDAAWWALIDAGLLAGDDDAAGDGGGGQHGG